jgi:hypothetical protein
MEGEGLGILTLGMLAIGVALIAYGYWPRSK